MSLFRPAVTVLKSATGAPGPVGNPAVIESGGAGPPIGGPVVLRNPGSAGSPGPSPGSVPITPLGLAPKLGSPPPNTPLLGPSVPTVSSPFMLNADGAAP